MRDDKRPLCFIQFVQGFPHLLFFLLFQQAVFRRFFFRRSPIIGEIGDDIRFDDIFLDAFQITLFPVAFIFKCILKVFSANDKEIGTAAWWHKPLCDCPCFSELPMRQLSLTEEAFVKILSLQGLLANSTKSSPNNDSQAQPFNFSPSWKAWPTTGPIRR